MHRVALRNTVRAAAVAAGPKVRFFRPETTIWRTYRAFARRRLLSARPPPPLASVKLTAPARWQPTIDALLRLAASLDCTPRVFGSFAWQALTDLDYVTPKSDLDLLWPLSPRIDELLTRLPALEAEAPGLIDGEIVGDGAAVNWRELAQPDAEVLLKTIHDVTVVPRVEFLARAASA